MSALAFCIADLSIMSCAGCAAKANPSERYNSEANGEIFPRAGLQALKSFFCNRDDVERKTLPRLTPLPMRKAIPKQMCDVREADNVWSFSERVSVLFFLFLPFFGISITFLYMLSKCILFCYDINRASA